MKPFGHQLLAGAALTNHQRRPLQRSEPGNMFKR